MGVVPLALCRFQFWPQVELTKHKLFCETPRQTRPFLPSTLDAQGKTSRVFMVRLFKIIH